MQLTLKGKLTNYQRGMRLDRFTSATLGNVRTSRLVRALHNNPTYNAIDAVACEVCASSLCGRSDPLYPEITNPIYLLEKWCAYPFARRPGVGFSNAQKKRIATAARK